MKADTIEQFKIIEHIKANFHMEYIKYELIDRYTVEIEDKTGEKMTFKYENGNITHS